MLEIQMDNFLDVLLKNSSYTNEHCGRNFSGKIMVLHFYLTFLTTNVQNENCLPLRML